MFVWVPVTGKVAKVQEPLPNHLIPQVELNSPFLTIYQFSFLFFDMFKSTYVSLRCSLNKSSSLVICFPMVNKMAAILFWPIGKQNFKLFGIPMFSIQASTVATLSKNYVNVNSF